MDYADAIDRKRVISSPEVLGIDEVHICDKMRLVLTDSEHGTLIDMHPRKTIPTVKKAIHALEDYENIKIVTMDMDTGYRNAVKELIPSAMVVIDRFHVVSHISTATQSAKKQIVENLKVSVKAMPPGPDKDRKLQLLRDLGKDSYLFKFGKKKIEKSTQRQEFLLQLCNEFPELRDLYTVKRNAERIYEDATTAEDAMNLFDVFKKSIPKNDPAYQEFHKFENMFIHWNKEILNYFRSGKQFTNAATEGLNNQIKMINNEGKGYSFETLRAKCIVNLFGKEKQHVVSSRKKYKKNKNN